MDDPQTPLSIRPKITPLNIRVIVVDDDEALVVEYVFDINDYNQRRVFAEQMTNAYLGGQVVTTFADDWTPENGSRLKAFMAQRWLPAPGDDA